MSERIGNNYPELEKMVSLRNKPLDALSTEERHAWYMDYMKTVDEENVMMLSGMPIEIHDDANAFANFVAEKQREMKVSEEAYEV